MTLAASGAETITHLLSLYNSMLLVIGSVRFANEISMDCLFHTTKTLNSKKNMTITCWNFTFLIHMSGPDSST